MDKKNFLKILKPLVKECLSEMCIELVAKQIVEASLRKNADIFTSTSNSSSVLSENTVNKPKVDKDAIKRRLNIDESEWESIYSDTLNSDAMKTFMSNEKENKELVSESSLHQLGLARDYSKFIK